MSNRWYVSIAGLSCMHPLIAGHRSAPGASTKPDSSAQQAKRTPAQELLVQALMIQSTLSSRCCIVVKSSDMAESPYSWLGMCIYAAGCLAPICSVGPAMTKLAPVCSLGRAVIELAPICSLGSAVIHLAPICCLGCAVMELLLIAITSPSK